MSDSRFVRFIKRKVPSRKRTRWLWGANEDTRKYVKCWRCGFVVNVTRDLGDSSQDGTYYTDGPVYSPGAGAGDQKYLTPTLDGVGMVGTCLQNGPDGNPVTTYYTPRLEHVNRGCPACGVTNLP